MEAGVGSAAELITGQGKECDLEVLKIAIGLLEENKVSS